MAAAQGVLTMHLVWIFVQFPEHPPIPLTEALRILCKVIPELPNICSTVS